jgi:hypothetical protein
LLLETQPDQPGVVSVSARDGMPRLDQLGLRFAARFDDIDAALMHLHECLRRHLNTLEPRSYRVDLEEAVAAADAVELDHRRIFVEPELAAHGTLDARIEALHRRHRRYDRLMNAIGVFALIALILLSFLRL